VTRLAKRDVERLLADYDTEPVAALSRALRRLLDRPHATWPELIATARFADARRDALLAGDEATMDGLVRELNERRALG
jgi:hypothetical protein